MFNWLSGLRAGEIVGRFLILLGIAVMCFAAFFGGGVTWFLAGIGLLAISAPFLVV